MTWRWFLSAAAVAFVLVLAGRSAIGVHAAATIDPAFSASYTLTDLGSVSGLPPKYGGMTFQNSDPNTILVGGNANEAGGHLYAVSVTRGAGNHITGLGSASLVADAPYNDGGVSYGRATSSFSHAGRKTKSASSSLAAPAPTRSSTLVRWGSIRPRAAAASYRPASPAPAN